MFALFLLTTKYIIIVPNKFVDANIIGITPTDIMSINLRNSTKTPNIQHRLINKIDNVGFVVFSYLIGFCVAKCRSNTVNKNNVPPINIIQSRNECRYR